MVKRKNVEFVKITCDRCGESMGETPDTIDYSFKHISHKVNKDKFMHVFMSEADTEKYVEEINILPVVEEVNVVTYYKQKTSEYDLCPECAKAFKRFMKNKK